MLYGFVSMRVVYGILLDPLFMINLCEGRVDRSWEFGESVAEVVWE